MAGSLEQGEGVVGVLTVLEAEREGEVEDEDEVDAVAGADRYLELASKLSKETEMSLDMAFEVSIQRLRWLRYLLLNLPGGFS